MQKTRQTEHLRPVRWDIKVLRRERSKERIG